MPDRRQSLFEIVDGGKKLRIIKDNGGGSSIKLLFDREMIF
ncbi:hypothetical protein [Bradyrhizobium sp.]